MQFLALHQVPLFFGASTPLGEGTDDRLAALVNVDVLDLHILLALATMPVQRFHQRSIGAGKLIRLGQVLASGLRRSAHRSLPAGSTPSRRCDWRSAAQSACPRARLVAASPSWRSSPPASGAAARRDPNSSSKGRNRPG